MTSLDAETDSKPIIIIIKFTQFVDSLRPPPFVTDVRVLRGPDPNCGAQALDIFYWGLYPLDIHVDIRQLQKSNLNSSSRRSSSFISS